VTISKREIAGTERISENLRREELIVDQRGNLVGEEHGERLRPKNDATGVADAAGARQADTDDGLPLSAEQAAAGTAIVGERPFEYTYGVMEDAAGPLAEGVPVVTADGEVLGTVGEVGADRFQVRAPLASDYWLPRHAVTEVALGGDLVVAVGREQIDEAKVDPPSGC
jgi:hypothetical protein